MTTLRTRATLLIGSSFTIMAAAAIAPALPNITHHFRDVPNADLLTRLLLTVVGLSIALTAPAIGLLLDRVGRKPVLVAALLTLGPCPASSLASGHAWQPGPDDLMHLAFGSIYPV